VIPTDFLLGLAVGLAISAASYLAVRLYLSRQSRRLRSVGASPDAGLASLPPYSTATPRARPLFLPSPIAAVSSPSGSGSPAESTARSSPISPPGVPEAPPTPREFTTTTRIHVAEPTLQLSHRVVLHLYAQGTLSSEAVAPPSLSQTGMREALSARQGALAGVLQRLEAAGITETSTAHVRGANRRVKVYRLTTRGQALARQLASDRTAAARSEARR
jgi:DNA-binding MarR family transcriptional regulator